MGKLPPLRLFVAYLADSASRRIVTGNQLKWFFSFGGCSEPRYNTWRWLRKIGSGGNSLIHPKEREGNNSIGRLF